MAKNENPLNGPQIPLITPMQVALSSPLKLRRRRVGPQYPMGVARFADEATHTRPQHSPIGFDFLTGSNDGTPARLTRGGGAIATGAPVQLIFWGSIWNGPGTLPSTSQIISAVQNILEGPFMSGLLQYGVNRSPFRGAIVVTSPEPPFGVNTFDAGDLEELIGALIENGTFPEPDEDGGRNIYVVVMPPATNFDGDPDVGGAHSYFSSGTIADIDNAWYAWIGNGPIDLMTRAFGHELVETCTDPEGDGWTVDGAPEHLNEIGDVCTKKSTNKVNGVTLDGYWSQLDNACLLPTEYSLKRFLLSSGLDPAKGLRPIMFPPPPLPHLPSLRALMKL